MICSKCHEDKPESDFHKKNNARGKSYLCRTCKNTYAREVWYVKNKDKQKMQSKKWKGLNKAKVISTRYGIDLSLVEETIAKANGSCEICGSTENLVLDHCHKTNKPRGILCRTCNLRLGWVGDENEDVVNKCNMMIKYILSR